MLDGISLDQLRTFSTAVEEGSRLKVLSIEAVPADGLPLPMSSSIPAHRLLDLPTGGSCGSFKSSRRPLDCGHCEFPRLIALRAP